MDKRPNTNIYKTVMKHVILEKIDCQVLVQSLKPPDH